jgi:tetratricopeptide (TPR) repeat protein
MKLHAFVAMPFGVKPDSQGNPIDFNRVYIELIKPALEMAGLQALRADEETRAGDIRTDMFQELLIADLMVADLTQDNPNVWYELGVRHALRARGVVLICGGRSTTAFDLYTDRKLRYSLRDGAPDPATLQHDTQQLCAMFQSTLAAWHGRIVSPVYQLLPNLREPDWKSLRIGDVREFWERYDAWQDRVELARRAGNIGDVLVLADEAPVAAFRSDAWICAGEALRRAERFRFALEQLERGLEVDPGNLEGLHEKAICLQRLAYSGSPGYSPDRAREHCRDVLERYPDDTETWALLGRIDKDAWVAAWRIPGHTPEQMRADAAYEDALLRAAIDSYTQGYRRAPGHYYSGINALTLMHLFRHLTHDTRYDCELAMLAGAVRYAALCEADDAAQFWSRASLGDLEVLTGTPETTQAAYKEAIAKNERDWFALESCRAQLQLLNDLGFRPDTVAAGIATFERAQRTLAKPELSWQPRQVILFSGHMIDEADRATPRFPAAMEARAAQKIAAVLDQLGANADDLAFTQGACGGDLLFTEACLQRGIKVQWLQPYREPEFIQKSVVNCGESWRSRYYDARAKTPPPRFAPDELGEPPPNAEPGYAYTRCNLWLLYSALACGIDKVRFVCLWNGSGGDGPGGTEHMYDEVERRTGRVSWIDTRTL